MPSSLAAWVRRITEPSPEIRAADARRQARTLVGLYVGLGLATLCAMGIQVAVEPGLLGATLRLLPWFVFIPLGYALARSRHANWATGLLVSLALATNVAAILGDPGDILLFAYFVVPVAIAGSLVDVRRAAVVLGVVVAVSVGLLAWVSPVVGAGVAVRAGVAVGFLLLVILGALMHLRAVEGERRRDLASREALARRLLEASFGGLAVVRDGVIQEANDGFARLFGLGREAVAGRSVSDLLPDVRLEGASGPSIPVEVAGRRADGTFVPVSLVSRPDSSPSGLEHVVAVQDLSERDAIQARLHQADRMAAMGHLAAGVAHEINNPLTWVIGNLDHLLAAGIEGDLRRAVEQAGEGARRVRRIARDLDTFARAREGPVVGVDLGRVGRSAANMVRHDVEVAARLVEDYGPAPTVDADPTRLAQACMNLLVNAAQAVAGGKGTRVAVRVGTGPDGRALFSVEDDGPGIPPELQARVFEPFFSTKDDGTGLGLPICRSLVQELGGEMFLDSAPGNGTHIGFRLPPGRLPTAPSVDDDTGEAEPSVPGRARVLIIDDEPSICELLQMALTEHDVAVATSGEEGRRRALEQPWDVILCDLMMPVVSGMDVHAALAARATGGEGRMVFLTGGAFTEEARRFLDASKNPVIFKPFRLGKVREVVAQALATTRTDARSSAPRATS